MGAISRLHCTGADVAPRTHGGGYPARLLPRHEKPLRSQVRRQQDAKLEELRTHLEEPAGLAVSISTVSRALSRLDLGRKKQSGGHRHGDDAPLRPGAAW